MTDASTPTDDPGRRPDGAPGRRRWPRVLAAVAGLLALVLGAAGVYAFQVNRSITENITRGIDLPGAEPSDGAASQPTAQPAPTGPLNYLLLGSDSRDPADLAEGRSDSIMLVHLDRQRDQAYIISFPRDMYVEIPGHGRNKINEAYEIGGPALTARTVQELTGVRMDHLALVDFDGFIGLTDDLGGVTVDNPNSFSSHGYDYPKGKITIRGEKALWFVRERKSLPEGDLDRAANQRLVIKAIVAKGLSADVIADPARFTAFVGNLAKHITVDNSLTDAEIRQTALSLRLQSEDIELLQAPISGFATTADGQAIDVVDEKQLAELAKALQDDAMADYVRKHPQG